MLLPARHAPGGLRAASTTSSRRPAGVAWAAGGFGRSNKKRVDTADGLITKPAKMKGLTAADLLDDEAGPSSRSSKAAAAGAPPPGFPKDWVDLKFKASDMPLGKNVKPLVLAGSGKAVMVYVFEGMCFVSDAESTAYKYPLTDAKVFRWPETGAVAAEVPLDGTVYDLASGEVLRWVPNDNPIRGLLSALKSKTEPVPLRVYPVHVQKDGAVWTKLL